MAACMWIRSIFFDSAAQTEFKTAPLQTFCLWSSSSSHLKMHRHLHSQMATLCAAPPESRPFREDISSPNHLLGADTTCQSRDSSEPVPDGVAVWTLALTPQILPRVCGLEQPLETAQAMKSIAITTYCQVQSSLPVSFLPILMEDGSLPLDQCARERKEQTVHDQVQNGVTERVVRRPQHSQVRPRELTVGQ